MNLTMLYRKKEAAALGETMRSYRASTFPELICYVTGGS